MGWPEKLFIGALVFFAVLTLYVVAEQKVSDIRQSRLNEKLDEVNRKVL